MVSRTTRGHTNALYSLYIGNCLFASLSDQLYGTPAKHGEIRANIIEHMRTLRPLFEHYVHKDDVQQRRALRPRSTSSRKNETDDAFEEYLLLMSRNGTYGGEPELVAFCQLYDQDVTVHLPRIHKFDRNDILYKNEHRETGIEVPSLHICYGGDEVTRAHYDSARCRDGSQPRPAESQAPESIRASQHGIGTTSSSQGVTNRAIRNSKSDLSTDIIHDFIRKGKKDVEGVLGDLNDRDRSPSIASSHRSSSSKRSLEDDAEHHRSTKRADRRRSARKRTEINNTGPESERDFSFRLQLDSPSPSTPASTQGTEYSSETTEQHTSTTIDEDYRNSKTSDEASDSDVSQQAAHGANPRTRKVLKTMPRRGTPEASTYLMAVSEQPRSTVRT